MDYFIGIDDTDNSEGREMVSRVCSLGESLTKAGFGYIEGITRHQLLANPQIHYKEHNSSLCLVIKTPKECRQELTNFCREFLLRDPSEGFGAGLCVAAKKNITQAVTIYGEMAKKQNLCRRIARDLADNLDIVLEELTCDGGGINGALAAVGLRYGGNDGRFIWMKGIRKLTGIFSAQSIYHYTDIDEIRNMQGYLVDYNTWIDVGQWPSPILRHKKALLLVDEVTDQEELCNCRVVSSKVIEKLSE